MDEPSLKPIDYDSEKQLLKRRWKVMAVFVILAALFASTFLPFWPASGLNGRQRTSFWKSDFFGIIG